MKAWCRSTRGLLAAALLFPACLPAQPQVSESASPPPAIDETVPPASDNYPLPPDAKPMAGITAGTTFQFDMADSKIFPGTKRTITVYVPAAYQGDKPACVYVGLDGLGFNAATVFDNLIAQHAMPITIGIGVSPGVVASARPPDNPRFDRSFEFDSRSDRLARFLLEEVLPEVERHTAAEGHAIRLSNDPNDRAIGGGSTGAIAAFTVAWERPNAFRRVFSSIGTYVGMRGGEQYYVLVRKTDPKPLRIFMQDGVHNEWPGGPEMGNWWMSNQTMNRALEFAGYDVRHTWAREHITATRPHRSFPKRCAGCGETGRRLSAPHHPAPGTQGDPAAGRRLAGGCERLRICNHAGGKSAGGGFLPGQGAGKIAEIVADGKPMPCGQPAADTAFAFGADGRLYSTRTEGGVKAPLPAPVKILGQGLDISSLTVRNNGDIYAVTRTYELWLIRANGEKVRLDKDLKGASAVALSPDGLWLFVAQGLSRTGLSYRAGRRISRRPRGILRLLCSHLGGRQRCGRDCYGPRWTGLCCHADGRAGFRSQRACGAILPLPDNAGVRPLFRRS